MADCFVVLDHLLGKFVDWIIKLLFCMNFLAYCGFPNILVMIPRPWPRLLPTFKSFATKHSFVLFQSKEFQLYCKTLIVCPCWFIAIERYWNFKLYCTTFFSKICTSKFGVRLIYGCGLYMDVYGKWFHFRHIFWVDFSQQKIKQCLVYLFFWHLLSFMWLNVI